MIDIVLITGDHHHAFTRYFSPNMDEVRDFNGVFPSDIRIIEFWNREGLGVLLRTLPGRLTYIKVNAVIEELHSYPGLHGMRCIAINHLIGRCKTQIIRHWEKVYRENPSRPMMPPLVMGYGYLAPRDPTTDIQLTQLAHYTHNQLTNEWLTDHIRWSNNDHLGISCWSSERFIDTHVRPRIPVGFGIRI